MTADNEAKIAFSQQLCFLSRMMQSLLVLFSDTSEKPSGTVARLWEDKA